MGIFLEEKAHLPENPKFLSNKENIVFVDKKYEPVNEYLKDVENMFDCQIWTRHLRLPNRGETRHFFYIRQQLCRL